MQKINIVIAIACFIVGYAAHFFVASEPQVMPDHAAGMDKISQADKVSKTAELNAEIVRLKQRIASLEINKPQALPNRSAGDPAANPQKIQAPQPQDTNDKLAELMDYRANNEIKNHQDYLAKLGAVGGRAPQVLSENFNSEPVDPSWSAREKSALDNYIQQHEAMSALPNISSECRAQQCRLSLLSDDSQSMASLSKALDQIMDSEDNAFSSYNLVVDPVNHSTAVYFERSH